MPEEHIEQLLDRDTYRKIKKMDRETLQGLIQDIHESGRKKGRAELIDLEGLRTEIGQIQGIGEKRTERIMELVEKYMTSKKPVRQTENIKV